MKYTFLLIAVVFLIGLTGSDGAGGKNDGAEKKDGAKNKKEEKKGAKEGVKDDKNGGKAEEKEAEKKKGTKKKEEEEEKGSEDEQEEENKGKASDSEEEEEDEKPKGKKNKSGKKKSEPQKSKKKKQQESDEEEEQEEDDDEEEEDDAATKALLKKLTKLKDEVASINPGSLMSALKKTPAAKMDRALPLMRRLAKTLKGTPMGPIMENLTSLMSNKDPKMWNLVNKLFPDFAATVINYAGQLGSTAAVTAGRLGKTFVDVGDLAANAGKDLLDTLDPVASLIPGGDLLLGLGKQSIETAQVATLDPADAASKALRRSGKDGMKELQRAQSRRRGNL